MTIPYATTNELLPRYLAKSLESAGYELVPYIEKLDLDSFAVIILFSPMFLHDHYVTPDAVWQKYFKTHKPGLRLISAGFAGPVHSNYLDLSDIPADIDGFISRALPVSADIAPANVGGLDMTAKLKRFFEGHGGESIMNVFNALQRATSVIGYLQAQPGGEAEINSAYFGPDADFVHRWRRFSQRWARYHSFFVCLPFYSLFQKMDENVNKLDQVFNSVLLDLDLYTTSGSPAMIAEISELLANIELYA